MAIDEALSCILSGAHYSLHTVEGDAYCTSYESCPFQSKDSFMFDDYGPIQEERALRLCLFREKMEQFYEDAKNGRFGRKA